MIRDVILPDQSRDDWPEIRARIQKRVLQSMGDFPEPQESLDFEVLAEQSRDGLLIREFRFSPVPGVTTYGSLVKPPSGRATGGGVLCMHGTDPRLAHRNVLSPDERPNRPYAIELAHRGVTTMAVDQFGFGEGNGDHTQQEVVASFYRQYPNWSLDGVRLRVHQQAIDLFSQCAGADLGRIGCIGNSLGGRTAVYLAALDERISACVAGAGVSPNITNVFRNPPQPPGLSPRLDEGIRKTGVPLFEYQEMLSLIAPRGVLLLEPWNDRYNPLVEPVLRCFEKARFVFQRCDAPEQIQILCHGDGHDTIPIVRQYAYDWLLQRL